MSLKTIVFILVIALEILSAVPSGIHLHTESDVYYVFDGDVIRVKCKASDSTGIGGVIHISWHKQDDSEPSLKNSSTTTITSTSQGNRTISVLTISVSATTKPRLYFYCKARNNHTTAATIQPFAYIDRSLTPRFKMQTLALGAERVNLICRVSSNIHLTSVRLSWMHNNQTLNETIVNITRSQTVIHTLLLENLMREDFGVYKCVANISLYEKVWQESRTTLLIRGPHKNAGIPVISTQILHVTCLVLSFHFCSWTRTFFWWKMFLA